MNSYISYYTNSSLRIVFKDDEYSPRLRLIDDNNKTASFSIAFADADNENLDKIRAAMQFAAAAFNSAFEHSLSELTEQEKQLTLEEMSLDEIDF